jgi:hypothetical protein
VLGDAGKQLELGHGKAEGGIGGARRPAHGPAQPGHDIGELRADLLAAGLIRASSNRAGLIWASINWARLHAGLHAGLLR